MDSMLPSSARPRQTTKPLTCAECSHKESWQNSGNPNSRQWHWHPARCERKDVQSLLHDEAVRRRDRARPFDEPRHHCQATRRQDRLRDEAWRIYRVHHQPAALKRVRLETRMTSSGTSRHLVRWSGMSEVRSRQEMDGEKSNRRDCPKADLPLQVNQSSTYLACSDTSAFIDSRERGNNWVRP